MQIEPRASRQLPAEWTGARNFIEQWLRRRCVIDSLLQFVGGLGMVVAGIIALALTSGLTAGVIFFLAMEANALLGAAGADVSIMRPGFFGVVFLIVMALSVVYAWKTRRESSGAAQINFDSSWAALGSLAMEFIAAGPIFMVLAAQDFHKSFRLSRMDIPQVSAVLLWLYDKNDRGGFAELSLAFPGLNIVRVLPQLRDISGVYWWPQEGEIALSEEFQKTLAGILGRSPKGIPSPGRGTREPRQPRFAESPPHGVSSEMVAWYSTLNLPPFATLQQVKARYRKLAKIYHPDARAQDRATGSGASDDEQMKRINEAYHNLLKHSQNQAGSF